MNLHLTLFILISTWLTNYCHCDIYAKILEKLGGEEGDPRIPKRKNVEQRNENHENDKSQSSKLTQTKEHDDGLPNVSELQQVIEELKLKINSLTENKIEQTKGDDNGLPNVSELQQVIKELKLQIKSLAENKIENTNQLTDCQSKLSGDVRTTNNSFTYFRQFVKIFAKQFQPVDGDLNLLGVKTVMKMEKFKELKKKLAEQTSPKEVLDHLQLHFSFQPIEPTKSVFEYPMSFIDTTVLVVVLVVIVTLVFAVFLMKLLVFKGVNWRKLVVITLFAGFLCSIPWEWYRMYRVELSKKASIMMKEIPSDCNPKGFTAWDSVTTWYRSTFSFNDDRCTKYHESVMVDPIWEVSPLQATSVCLSRFFFEPMKYISGSIGASFRELFKEIPAQWQPFLFIAIFIIIVIIIFSIFGLNIRTPFLSINVNPQPEIRYERNPDVIAANPVPITILDRNNEQLIPNDMINQRTTKLRRRNVSRTDTEDMIVDDVGMSLIEPPNPNSDHLSVENTNDIEDENIPSPPTRNKRSNPVDDTSKRNNLLDSTSEITEVLTKMTLHNKCIQEEEPFTSKESDETSTDVITKLPVENEYDSLHENLENRGRRPEQDSDDITNVTKTLSTDRKSSKFSISGNGDSSEGLVPDFSSVFSIPLGMTGSGSISEVSDSFVTVSGIDATNSATTTTADSVETLCAGIPSTTDDGFLVINE